MKRLFKKSQKVAKGTSSAVVLSILIHAALFLLAGMLVVFTVVKKEEKKFEPPKAVERPKMKLKKPKVKVRKTSKPKPTTRIVTKMSRANMPDIQLPEMSGMGTGLAGGLGGFDMMPDFNEVSVFGTGQSIGNDFEGYLYDFKRNRQGRGVPMGDDMFRTELRKFVLSGWKTSRLARYYRSPNKLYTTHFIIPPVPTPMAPDIFGSPEMESYYFMMHYKGQLVSTKPITFRFRGAGDAYMMVRVGGSEVLLACWFFHDVFFDWWQSTDADSRKYYLGNQQAAIGDWITLEPGEPVDMEVMFGEYRGGDLSAILTVEIQGEEYEKNKYGAPILPAFKTAEFSQDLIEEIQQYLPVNEVSLTNGPVFCDYETSTVSGNTAVAVPAPEAMPQEESGKEARTWTLADGRMFDAKFVTLIAGKVVLENTKRKMVKLSPEQFSAQDQEFIQLEMPPDLDISFSKQSTQRTYPDTLSTDIPRSFYYDFSATIKQTSPGSYDHELQVEVFTIGAEVGRGDRHILLDRHESPFLLTKENRRTVRVGGETVELIDYFAGNARIGKRHRGRKYASYLVVVTDERGKIIAYETPKKWLFENLENLREIPVGRYFDDTCTRVGPTRPKSYVGFFDQR